MCTAYGLVVFDNPPFAMGLRYAETLSPYIHEIVNYSGVSTIHSGVSLSGILPVTIRSWLIHNPFTLHQTVEPQQYANIYIKLQEIACFIKTIPILRRLCSGPIQSTCMPHLYPGNKLYIGNWIEMMPMFRGMGGSLAKQYSNKCK